MKPNSFQSQFLGLVPYSEALTKMLILRDERLSGKIPDQLLFLEHPPVITMGRRESSSDLKFDRAHFLEKGINFVKTDRGGKLTCHAPGQLVIYFIFNIEERRLKIGELVHQAEEGILRLLELKGIHAGRNKKNPGLWVGNNKIASLGFHVHHGVTTHGVALNVKNDLQPFSYFIPCGMADAGVTSMKELVGKDFSLKEVGIALKKMYEKLFCT